MSNILYLNNRQLCDLELLLNGGFSPLKGYMNRKDYYSCLHNMTLEDGSVWPIPIILATSELYNINDIIILKDMTGIAIASLTLDDIYKPDLVEECKYTLGTNDMNHPYHSIIMENRDKQYIGGKVTRITLPLHYDFMNLRMTPNDTKQYFKNNEWTDVVGFQTRNPMHRSHFELTQFALKEIGPNAKLLLHPVVGVTQDCDIDYHTRVRCYKKLVTKYTDNTVLLSLLPLSMRMAGPREALWHALIRKNYGCTHFIVGRDHAGPSYKTKDGKNFYGPYEAQELLLSLQDKIGIKIIMSPAIVYVKETYTYMRENEVPENSTIMNISGTMQRDMLANNTDIPSWFSWPDIIEELRCEFKNLNNKGLCIYIVGLSGSGKSTIANYLIEKLKEIEPNKKITLLDADVIRMNLSKGLGFSKEDRSMNVRRIGYVASEIVKHGGIVICANIAPYDEDRLYNRKLISMYGKYIEVYMRTSLECCIKRDTKGLYRAAIEGKVKNFTGISDPFEEPTKSDLILDGEVDLESNLNHIISRLNLTKKEEEYKFENIKLNDWIELVKTTHKLLNNIDKNIYDFIYMNERILVIEEINIILDKLKLKLQNIFPKIPVLYEKQDNSNYYFHVSINNNNINIDLYFNNHSILNINTNKNVIYYTENNDTLKIELQNNELQNKNFENRNIEDWTQLIKEIHEKVINIYNSDFDVFYKEDKSPVTEADTMVSKMIENKLKSWFPNIPILCEENKMIPYEERKDWKYFFLIDPIDGTKEFINKNGEFTVNIGLCFENKPIFGIVSIPTQNIMYYGVKDKGAWKLDLNTNELIQIKCKDTYDGNINIVVSSSHMDTMTQDYIDTFENKTILKCGSSIKFMKVAEGLADLYPRFGNTMEWDTCASHIIVEEAGGMIKELSYNKPELLNGSFKCYNEKNMKELLIHNIKKNDLSYTIYGNHIYSNLWYTDNKNKVCITFTPRGGCSVSFQQYLDLNNLLNDGLNYNDFIHWYRIHIFIPNITYKNINELINEKYTFIKFIINPYIRAVSIFRAQTSHNLSFREYLKQLVNNNVDYFNGNDKYHYHEQYIKDEEKIITKYIKINENEKYTINLHNKPYELNVNNYSSSHHGKKTEYTEFCGDTPKDTINKKLPKSYKYFYDDEIKCLVDIYYKNDIDKYDFTFDNF